MSSDLIELALEGFDHATDKYYDSFHDGVRGGYNKVGPWMKKHGVWTRTRRSSSMPNKPVKLERQSTTPPLQDFIDEEIAAKAGGDGTHTKFPAEDRGRDAGRNAPQPQRERVRDDEQQYSPPYRTDSKVKDLARPLPQFSLSYPQNEQLMAMPTGAGYRAPDYRASPPVDEFYRDHGRRGRARSAYSPSRSRSRSRSRRHRSRDHDLHRGRSKRDKDRDHKERHLAASFAGAVAGAYLGREAGKGDTMATVAGAVIGALGANVAERGYERHKMKDKKEDRDWERKYGRQ